MDLRKVLAEAIHRERVHGGEDIGWRCACELRLEYDAADAVLSRLSQPDFLDEFAFRVANEIPPGADQLTVVDTARRVLSDMLGGGS